MTERNCSGVSRVAGTAVPMPALLTRTSTRPNVSIASSTSRWHCVGVGHVGGHRVHAPAGGAYGLGHRLELVDPPRAEDHVGPRLGERVGERDAQAAGGAGDDDDLVVETEEVQEAHGATLATYCAAGTASGTGARGRVRTDREESTSATTATYATAEVMRTGR